jgi:phosphatidylserine/phosphatidylglycerophosphate/cardiolipin synthase-like enzyme
MKKFLLCAAIAAAPVFAHAGMLDSALENMGIWHDSSTSQSAGGTHYRKSSNEHGNFRKTSYESDDYNDTASRTAPKHSTVIYPATGQVEMGFSPNRGAMDVVIHVINASTRTLDIAAYEFTNKRFEAAVVKAIQRGVAVRIVVDSKENVGNPKSIAGPLAQAGAHVRYVDDAPLMHDKYTIEDHDTAETGSLNYTLRAERYSHENAKADWHNQAEAAYYESDFEYMWENGHPWH